MFASSGSPALARRLQIVRRLFCGNRNRDAEEQHMRQEIENRAQRLETDGMRERRERQNDKPHEKKHGDPEQRTGHQSMARTCQIFCVRGGLHLVRGSDEAISVQHSELVHRQLPFSR
ncbi:hypothetical protein [Povalibacter sp.]|uniref:hypothetical protein n=1 Tax=Povalibacter sp. TaxID=1962978 RepID=UPI002F3F8877